MINAIVFLFFAYLNPNADINAIILESGYTNSNISTEVIRNTKDLDKIDKLYEKEINFPKTYFINETLILLSLESNDNPNTFEVVDIDNNKNELSIFYKTEKFKEIRKKSGNPYAVVKIKPFNSKDKNINLIDTDKSKPLLSNLSLGRAPKYDNSLIKQSDKLYIDYLPLDKGNSWSYKVENNGTLESTTVNIISIYEGWSLVDDFFGKKNIGFKIDADGEFLVAYNSEITPFYNGKDIQFLKSNESFEVLAGKFSDLLIVTIPKNNKLWFKDVYAKGIGLIYHKHSSPKGSVIYRLEDAKIRGKSIK